MTNDLTTARRELLARRLRAAGLTTTPSSVAADPAALTAPERRMWFGQRRDPSGTELNIPFAYRLTGELDADRLLGALHAVVERHPALRTVFDEDGAGPRRTVRAAQVGWQRTDLTDLTEGERERRIRVLARRDADAPFDLSRDPLLRAHLIRTAAREHVLALVVHHIAFDDASFALLLTDLAAAYAGRSLPPAAAGRAVVAPAPADRERVAAAAERLRPLPDPVALPGDTGTDVGPASASAALPDGLDDAVAGAARALGVTPFTWLLTAHAVLVARLFDADDAAVSVPVTARPAGTEDAIGYFGTITVRRLTARPGESFRTAALRVQDDGAAALAFADVPVDAVIGALDPARAGDADGFARLAQLSFSTRAAVPGPDLEGIASAPLELATPGAQVPFEASVIRAAPGTPESRIEVRFRRGRVDPAAVEAYLTALPVLLAATVADPDADVRTLPLTTAPHADDLIAAGRGRAVDAGHPDTLTGLWEAAVDRAPEALALLTDEDAVTYAEADRRAEVLARVLDRRGVQQGDVVALDLGGGIDFPVAALAVMKLGAAYLPVDPAYPAERKRLLLGDARPRLVLDAAAVRVALDGAQGTVDTADRTRITRTRPQDPAYVIYTSGSTGRPKGVVVAHAAIAEHLAGHLTAESLDPTDRLLLTGSVSFDASVFEVFGTLTAGATLVIGRPGGAADFGYISELVARHRVSVVHMVPSTLATYLMLPDAARWRSVRWIPVGGEALPGGVADRARAVLGARISNNYGPTEAVVAATGRMVDEPRAGETVPIGGPTPGTALYVLDRALTPVPDGIAGELYLGGEQLALGYLGDPVATASKFVADPWRSGGRMYRTGDRVRRRADGDLEFLGRTDDQVKIHGFRIEPGEVAAVLSGLEGVGGAAVVAVDDPVTGPALAAYLCPAEVDVAAVAAAAERALPAHLVPSAYVVLDALPIGPNGKLARSALPAPQRAAASGGRSPATATERTVAAAVARLLDRPATEIAATDSFFVLGGHSLLVTRLVAQLRAESGIELSVRAVFDGPTVEQIAAAIDVGAGGELRLPLLARHATLPDTVPLTASQRSIWFAAALAAGVDAAPGAGVIEAAVRLDGPVDAEALAAALGDVVARHDSLRTVFSTDDGVPTARVLGSWTPELPTVRVAEDPAGARAAFLARPFPLEGAPMLRAQLLVTGTATVLQVVVHHLVTDHRSMEILVDDLFAAYRARTLGAPVAAPPAHRFADHALWQAEVFGSESGRAAVDAVAAGLRDLPGQIPALHDHPRRAELTLTRGHRAVFHVEPALRARLREVAQRHGATEFVLADAALAVVLHRVAGGRDIAIGTAASARTEPALDAMAGLIANMVVLRTTVRPESTLADVLDSARSAAALAFDRQQVPFELVVDAVAPERGPGRNPLFQTVLHVRDDAAVLAPRTVAPGLGATRLPMDFDVALVDLAVSLFGTPDGGYDGAVIAGPAVYTAATAARLADAVARVLAAFVDPATRVDAVLPELGVRTEPVAPLLDAAADCARTDFGTTGSALSAEEALSQLLDILSELLGVPGITADDNYFAVGGDSVTSLQFAARATAIGVPVTPQLVFATATLGELVAAATAAGPGPATPDGADAAAPASTTGAAPVSTTGAAAMSASGLDADQLAALTAAWKDR
ncbi:Amino acid adenylation domain protein OS=Tsukamurella paurometabola (strain ATCC 8368 / DSM/ CCUG 35730 / CIP 100753 / JCM 10117 / KCTC 9821 / NBRC 16120/ NCIMB 702349 / NCTC 13040) OX=521096 GN=Tpau_4320 PE=4 SV=1 [Tsukamurella paurometabola]|uniref:Amino acid adenylation domain protein n=1 Tax=Tsukamurella paurometabola (strain ATCC 8368 / DSM 20162 / CCUG 35730 / CIP 100753 / JCM 10117 / KCTC 9821 / NBRC 16120 / NCIMB 702349 / NCTC 13040) TaxID=521096 RepID=D5UZ34_TSUPD|nr:non-ribosomal peptide synthetase [Tsukamurella paurometabola]ADG80881.1 amino acid adenylation domain protein [Tsukamurella paurometabola DSM 20162]SUQ39247.1 Dimodular nonribosomal peptide synthase [Tsukamurella paurometabola]